MSPNSLIPEIYDLTVEDAPVAHLSALLGATTLDETTANHSPRALRDRYSVQEDQPFTFRVADLLANDRDRDGDSLRVLDLGQPSKGILVDNGNGTVTYTPNANVQGRDRLTYTITDDRGGQSSSTVYFEIAALNDSPAAGDDTYEVQPHQGSVLRINRLLANDSDLDGDPLTLTNWSSPQSGSITRSGDTLIYTPISFQDTDHFTYSVSDGQGGSDTATVYLTRASQNSAPKADRDQFVLEEDQTLTIQKSELLANDRDGDGDALTVISFANPQRGGRLTDNGNGTVTYRPGSNFFGRDYVVYTVSDGRGGTDTATIRFTVNPVNDLPQAADDRYQLPAN